MLFALFHLGGHLSILVLCCHSWATWVLLGGFDKGNVSFPPILNTFHLGAFRSVINFGMVVTCTPKRLVVHPPMGRRDIMPRLMQQL
jgi:hypothetical protein